MRTYVVFAFILHYKRSMSAVCYSKYKITGVKSFGALSAVPEK